eukprot:7239900-Pyramimonas_sp.AAC.1
MWPPALGLWVKLPMGPRRAVLLGVADACGHPHWGRRWSSYGATKRSTECGGRMWPPPMGRCVELPMGPRSA